MKDQELREEFASYCWGLTKEDNQWVFFWELFEKEGDKYVLFKQKMNNLLEKLNQDDTELLKMDIEKDIYDTL